MERGALIVIEGVDGSGKTTQCERIVESFNGKVKGMQFPNRSTQTGMLIDAYLKGTTELPDQVIHLLYSANRWEQADEMQSLLDGGTSLIVDRYTYSGIAFSVAKETLSIEWCMSPDVGLPVPDVVIYLDLSPEEAKKRGGDDYGTERYEQEGFQQRVRNVYEKLRGDDDDDRWIIVDANRPMELVTQDVMDIVRETIS